jgi:hypothetical protein
MRSTGTLLIVMFWLGSEASYGQAALTAEQTRQIEACTALTGYAAELAQATPTFEDRSVLFLPIPGDDGGMFLYDLGAGQAASVDLLGPDGFRFRVVMPGRTPAVMELVQDEHGVFGPPDALDVLGISDSLLLEAQGRMCNAPCLEHNHMPACAACTAVALLRELRHVRMPMAEAAP